jgi:hypothetical protein
VQERGPLSGPGSRFLVKVDDQIGVVGVRVGGKLLPMNETE